MICLNKAITALSAFMLGVFFYSVNMAQTAAVSYVLAVTILSAVCFVLLHKVCANAAALPKAARPALFFCIFALFALVLRIVLCLATKGAGSDVSCFLGWANIAQSEGLAAFYTSGYFTDYPPGYIYPLYVMGKLVEQFSLQGPLAVLIVTLPALICDILLAVVSFVYLKPKSERMALAAAGFLLFSPLLLYNSAVWKQVDSAAALFLACCFAAQQRSRPVWSTICYAVALLIKPQVLIFGPVFALAFLREYVSGREKLLQAARRLASCGALSLVVIWLLALPFQGSQDSFWLVRRYAQTMGSYPFASVNGANFFAALGGNYRPVTEGFFLSWAQWGFLFLGLITLALLYFFVTAQREGRCDLFLLGGFYGTAVFTLMQGMHERYLILSILLLTFSAFEAQDDRLKGYVSVQSLVTLAGMLCPYLYMNDPEVYSSLMLGMPVRILGFLQTVLLLWLCCILIWRTSGRNMPHPVVHRAFFSVYCRPASLPWNRQDGLTVLLLTSVAALLSFWGLGDMQSPERGVKFTESQTFSVTLEEPASQLWVFSGIGDGVLLVQDTQTGELLLEQTNNYNSVFKWSASSIYPARELTITASGVTLNELVLTNQEGDVLAASVYDSEVAPLFDEQYKKPPRPSFSNSMYFDEIYHARTALEQFGGMSIYETTHPPLGKDIIMLGISLFGMTPFGWRFMGALFGMLMVPVLYLLARLLFASREIAFFCAGLFLFDFMRFTQTRIATIDSFVVLFILLSYLFMLLFLQRDFFIKDVKALLWPLFFCGLFFGMGCAVKWTGLYSGTGLCFLFFYSLWKNFKKCPDRYFFTRRCALLMACCVGFFVVIPATIYLLSYLPQFFNNGESLRIARVLENQRHMLSYHSALVSSHPFASAWWEWPLLLRPVWYFMGELLSEGLVQTIVLLGNPALWWTGAVALLLCIVAKLTGDRDDSLTFLLAGFCAQYLPWLLVRRETFLYHFFPSLGFVVLALGWVMQRLMQAFPKAKYGCAVLMLVCAGLFIWFYPALSGQITTAAHIASLHWLPRWSF